MRDKRAARERERGVETTTTSDSSKDPGAQNHHRRTKPDERGSHLSPPSLIIHLDATVPFSILFVLLSGRTTNTRRRRNAHIPLVVRRRVPTTTVTAFRTPGRAHVLLILGPDRSRFRVHAIERGGLARVVEAFERRACCRVLDSFSSAIFLLRLLGGRGRKGWTHRSRRGA